MAKRTPLWGSLGVCLCVLARASVAEAATIAVPAGGDLQSALNAAAPGDTVTLAPGAAYVGNFLLPVKSGSTYITLRSAAADSTLPRDGVRMTPAFAPQLPKLRSPNSLPAIRTAAGAHHWRLMFVEVQANLAGYGDAVSLGVGDASQSTLAQVPYAFVIDRVYIHGDPINGQKRGIALHSSDTTIVNSYIADIKAVGQEAQAISGFNGPGGYLIENNYLEGSTQSFLLGGADPIIPGLVTTNVTFRRNYLSKQLAWRDPIIATPAAVVATPMASAGSLAAGTYYYKVVARVPAGQTTKANSTPSAEVFASILPGTTGAVRISWTPVVGAADYVVYGRSAGAENTYWKTTDPFFTDTGAAGTAGTPASATKWLVKNIFELKNAQDVLVEGNIMENLWIAGQPGYSVLFTPRNQGGSAPWVVVQRVTFQHNLVRHSAGGVNVLGTDNVNPSQRTNQIVVRDNVFDDIDGTKWGTGSRPFQIGDGPDSITIDHNTIISTDSAIVWLYGGTATTPTAITNARYTNNMSVHNTYGIDGSSYSPGLSSINAYLPGAVVAANVLAGGTASKYPTGNFFPTVASWQANFVNYVGGDYHLLLTSGYKRLGTDGADLGANIDTVMAQTLNALTGDNSVPPGSNRVLITTPSLPNATVNQPYLQQVSCTGGSAPCAWLAGDVTLPAGVSFDTATGVVAGTPITMETGLVTITAYDPSLPTNRATATLSLTVDAPTLSISIPAAAVGQVGAAYTLTPTASGSIGSVSWSVASGSLPPGMSLNSQTGCVSGVPTSWGTTTAVLQIQDSWRADRSVSAPLTMSIAPTTLAAPGTIALNASAGQPFSANLPASGGTGSVVWTVTSGAWPAGIAMSAAGAISGSPQGIGTYTVTALATDANWPAFSAAVTVTLNVSAMTVTADAVAPSDGSGMGQTFAADYSDTAGAQDLSTAWVWFNGTFASSLANSCLFYYDRTANTLNLLDDAGGTWKTSTLGGSGVLQNSQCAVTLASSAAVASGNTLQLRLATAFKPAFAGRKNVYTFATSRFGIASGWQTRGAWTVPVPAVTSDSVTPSLGGGSAQTFSLRYSDTSGVTDLTSAWVWVNGAFTSSAANSCLVFYDRAANQLWLLDDAGTRWMPGVPGASGTLQNLQCTISLATTTVTAAGSTLTIDLPLTFSAAFTGAKGIYMYAAGANGLSSGWQARGIWAVP